MQVYIAMNETNREVTPLAVANKKSDIFLFLLREAFFCATQIENIEYPTEICDNNFLFENNFINKEDYEKDNIYYNDLETAFSKIVEYFNIQFEDKKTAFKTEYKTLSNNFGISLYVEEAPFLS